MKYLCEKCKKTYTNRMLCLEHEKRCDEGCHSCEHIGDDFNSNICKPCIKTTIIDNYKKTKKKSK